MKCPLQHKKGKLCWCGGHNQTNAKKNKLGLWTDSHPVNPYELRKKNK